MKSKKEIQDILDNAPEGATWYLKGDVDTGIEEGYAKKVGDIYYFGYQSWYEIEGECVDKPFPRVLLEDLRKELTEDLFVITLEDSAQIVSDLQESCMSLGYYLALAGGTLNKGYSSNDVDLVAVPRTSGSTKEDLIEYLKTKMVLVKPPTELSRGRMIDIFHFTYKGVNIDIAVVL